MSGLIPIALLLLPIAIVMVVMAVRRRSRRLGADAAPITLIATRFIALGYAVLTFVFTVISVISTLVADAVEVKIPVRQFWPEPYPWITIDLGPTASVTEGGFSMADVTVAGLGMDARLLLASGAAVQGLTLTVIAITVALLCHRLLTGMAFRPMLSRSINIAAIAIAAGGVLWQACFWIGGSIASAQVLTVTGWRSDDPSADDPLVTNFDPFATGLPEPNIAFNLDFWPIMLGLALAAVAAAFRYGERLQRDTEGLV